MSFPPSIPGHSIKVVMYMRTTLGLASEQGETKLLLGSACLCGLVVDMDFNWGPSVSAIYRNLFCAQKTEFDQLFLG